MAKRKITPLKKELWKLFSLYVKKIHSNGGWCKCFTCGCSIKIGTKNCQAGHWLPKGTYGYHYFNLDNVRPQCIKCNNYRLGDAEVFRRNLQKEIGKKKIDEMFETRNNGGSRSVEWYEAQIANYKKLLEEL